MLQLFLVMPLELVDLIWFFAIYSFVGWVWEVVFNLVAYRRWHFGGFLTMPLLPIYGFAALAVLLVVEPYVHNPFLVFAASVALITAIELLTGIILRRAFRVRLWDYSDWPLDFRGYVSMFSSIGFGVLALFLVYVAHPVVLNIVAAVPVLAAKIVAWVFVALLVMDFVNSLISLIRLRVDMRDINDTIDSIRHRIDERIESLAASGKTFRRSVEKWHRLNVRHIRWSFPKIRAFPKKSSRKTK